MASPAARPDGPEIINYFELGLYDTVNVEVARSPSGQLYLKGELDHGTPDQLLVLRQCR